jgi:hypothetical protein
LYLRTNRVCEKQSQKEALKAQSNQHENCEKERKKMQMGLRYSKLLQQNGGQHNSLAMRRLKEAA